MLSQSLPRRLVVGGAVLLGGLFADPGRAQTITNLTVSKDGGNNPDGLKTGSEYPGPGNHVATSDGHFVTVTASSRCGNGVVDPGEDCDDGGTADDDCCSSSCHFESSATVCRAAAGTCDVAEHCTGASGTCPADGFQPATVECRTAAGPCDVAELCTGAGPACPTDAKSIAVCRPSVGPCDPAESCDGVGDACPADALAPETLVCRAPAGPCDAPERCTGTGTECPPDVRAPAGTVCRAAVDACDVAESCDGAAADCPPEIGEHDTDGDGICDSVDTCAATSDPEQLDIDGDGIGDACDPCTNVFPTLLAKSRLIVSGLLTPPGDDRFSFTAAMRLPVPLSPPVDPISKGVRLVLVAQSGTQILDAALPGGRYAPVAGAGWKAMGGRAWLYRNNGLGSPPIGGIRRLTLRLGVSPARATIRVAVSGRDGSYAVDLHDMPLRSTIVIDAPVARHGQCGEGAFTLPDCAYDARLGRLRCRG